MKKVILHVAQSRLGKAVDAALNRRGSKCARNSVAAESAEGNRQLIGVQGFINDEYAAKKDERRREFANQVKNGLAKSTDASMFHGLAANSKVRYRSDEY